MDDLVNHTIIAYGETAAPEIREINWLLEAVRRRVTGKGRTIRINNVTGILSATMAGIGLAAVPDYVAAERPQLIRVLPDIPGPCFDVHLVYADALRQAKRVAAFRDFLVRSSRDWRY